MAAAAATATVIAAAMTLAVVMIMMVATDIGIEIQSVCQEQSNRFVSIAADTAVELDAGLTQCHLSAAADTAANHHIHLQHMQKACQSAVAAAVCVNDLSIHDLAVFCFVHLELRGVTEVLENIAVFISNCDTHRKTPPVSEYIFIILLF